MNLSLAVTILSLSLSLAACRPRGDLDTSSSETLSRTNISEADAATISQPTVIATSGVDDVRPSAVSFPQKLWVDPQSNAATDLALLKAEASPNPTQVKAQDYIASQSQAYWFGEWSGDISSAAKKHSDAVNREGATATSVLYYIPYRDCGNYGAGGARASEYRLWVQRYAAAIAQTPTLVILEPGAILFTECLSPELLRERYDLIQFAIKELKRNVRTRVYVDAGHPGWFTVEEAVKRLKLAGSDLADGFVLNISNHYSTEANVSYGNQISAALGGKSFIIDTSRNGKGPNTADFSSCNSPDRGLGSAPILKPSGLNKVDAFLWIKRPGESDGACNGGPNAGLFWRQAALQLYLNSVPTLP